MAFFLTESNVRLKSYGIREVWFETRRKSKKPWLIKKNDQRGKKKEVCLTLCVRNLIICSVVFKFVCYGCSLNRLLLDFFGKIVNNLHRWDFLDNKLSWASVKEDVLLTETGWLRNGCLILVLQLHMSHLADVLSDLLCRHLKLSVLVFDNRLVL